MFGICRHAATSTADIFHGREFFFANLICGGTAKFAAIEFLAGWIAEVVGLFCARATALTCIGHGNSPLVKAQTAWLR